MSKYRYWLSRPGVGDPVVFIMLNPSTVDDDPTIRRCRGFAAGRPFYVVNLFAYRATRPTDLWTVEDPIGPEGDDWLRVVADMGCTLIAAWGANAPAWRVDEVLPIFAGCNLYCLGDTTVHGAPRHPLYLDGSTELKLWRSSTR